MKPTGRVASLAGQAVPDGMAKMVHARTASMPQLAGCGVVPALRCTSVSVLATRWIPACLATASCGGQTPHDAGCVRQPVAPAGKHKSVAVFQFEGPVMEALGARSSRHRGRAA